MIPMRFPFQRNQGRPQTSNPSITSIGVAIHEIHRQLRLPLTHQYEGTVNGLSAVLDELKFTGGRAVVPREFVR